jgi:MFS family permease
MEITPALRKRLRPLYLAAFFQGLVLWYPVEKLFMRSIGFSDALIGLMIAVYSAVMILTEIPTGILADRWSRKGVLMLSSVMLALSALAGGFSHGIALFTVSASLWGMFFAMYSGANDAIVYDTLEEDGHHPDLFEKAYGRVRTIDSVALVIGSLVGGLVAAIYGPRVTFFLTIPSALASILVLAKFREPTLHKQKAAMLLTTHIRATLRAVLSHRELIPIVGVLILSAALEYMLFEFAQVWLLALHTPTSWYGPANAILLAGIAVGGVIAAYMRQNQLLFWPLLVAMVAGAIGLISLHNIVGAVTSQFLVLTASIAIGIYYLRTLHDNLSSEIRTGASSTVGTIGRLVLIPLALVFGVISSRSSIFRAGWLLVVAVVAITGLVLYLQTRTITDTEQ